VRRGHFEALEPICPRCHAERLGDRPLRLAAVFEAAGDDVRAGILHCPDAGCRTITSLADTDPWCWCCSKPYVPWDACPWLSD